MVKQPKRYRILLKYWKISIYKTLIIINRRHL